VRAKYKLPRSGVQIKYMACEKISVCKILPTVLEIRDPLFGGVQKPCRSHAGVQ